MKAPHSPYVGLVPYSEEDEPYFFGRSKERQTVAFNLRGARLTILYGPAGVGKSSILNAGVSHDLHRLALENQETSGYPEFVVVVFRLSRYNPIQELIKRIADSASVYQSDKEFTVNESQLVKVIAAWSTHLNSDLLIILDQFEDYFLHSGADSFTQEFTDAVNDSSLRVNFLISIREDALSKLDVFKEQMPRLFENYLRIEHLSRAAAQEAIKRPIDSYNHNCHPWPPYEIEDSLVDAVSNQVAVSEGLVLSQRGPVIGTESRSAIGGPVEAPLLQLVMKRLWEKEVAAHSHVLRLETLHQLGDAPSIVKIHLDDEMATLSTEDQEVAALIFYHLVTPSGWKIAHTVSDLARYTSRKEAQLEPVLNRLAEVRILRRIPSANDAEGVARRRFEIFHEMFALPVLNWLSSYTVNKRTADERAKFQEEKKRLMWFGFVAVLIALIFFLLYSYVYRQKKLAELAKQQVNNEKANAEKQLLLLNTLENEIPFSYSVMRGHSGIVNKAVFSPGGDLVATASQDLTARLWTASSGVERRQLQLNAPAIDIAFNSEGTMLAVASANHITLWDPNTGVSVTLEGHAANVRKIAFSTKDERFLASGDELGVIIVWDVNQKSEVQRPRAHSGRVNDVEWSSQNLQLVTAGDDSTAQIWDVSTGKTVQTIHHNQNQPSGSPRVNTAVFSPDGKEVLTAGDDWTATIWNAKTGVSIRKFRRHDGIVHSAEFGDGGITILTASADRTARLWDVTGKEILVLVGHSDEVLGARFSPDYSRVITWSKDRTARVWDASSGKLLLDLRAHIRPVASAEFSRNGRFVLTASEDYTARVWSIADVKALTVTDVKVSVEGTSYSDDCAKAFVRVFGRVSVAGAAGTVKYRFVLNGRPGLEHQLDFDGPGDKEVGGTYKFTSNTSGTVFLKITSPKSTDKRKLQPVAFHVRCKPSAPVENKSTPEPTPSLR